MPHTYNINVRGESNPVEGRNAAIAQAKEVSLQRASQVTVERADGVEKLGFRRGSLVQYFREAGRRS